MTTVKNVSLITVCLNCADTIELTLQNAREQTLGEVQHVVIDGGSSDGTVEIVEKYRVDYFVSEPDGGIYHAMEKGVAAATGDVVVFLNSGDLFYDRHVCEEVVAYFNQTGRDVVFGDFVPYLINPNDGYDHSAFTPNQVCRLDGVTNRNCLFHQNIHHQSLFYRRDIFDHCSFFSPEWPEGSDYELNVSALFGRGCSACYLPRVLTKFALGGTTTVDYEKEEQQFIRLRETMRKKYFAQPAAVPADEYVYVRPPAPRSVHWLTRMMGKLRPDRITRSAKRKRARRRSQKMMGELLRAGLSPNTVTEFIRRTDLLFGEKPVNRPAPDGFQHGRKETLTHLFDRLDQLQEALHHQQNTVGQISADLRRQREITDATMGKLLETTFRLANERDPRRRGYRFTSQFDEDGIIQCLQECVPIEKRVFVEFGVENYREANTNFLLRSGNWSGLVLDASDDNISQIKRSELYWKHNIQAVRAFITSENINDLIGAAGIAGDIGLLSIDIDGVDYWVWQAITVVQPRIVICEYNSMFGDSAKVVVPYKPEFDRTKEHYSWLYAGASLGALAHLAERKGYSLVASNVAGNNAFFVRNDVLGGLPPLSVKQAYVKAQFRESRGPSGEMTYLSIEQGVKLLGDLPVVDIETGETVAIKNLDCQNGDETLNADPQRGERAA